MLSTSRQQNAIVIKTTLLDYEWTRRTQIYMLQNHGHYLQRIFYWRPFFRVPFWTLQIAKTQLGCSEQFNFCHATWCGLLQHRKTEDNTPTEPCGSHSQRALERCRIWRHRLCDLRATVPQPEPHHSDPQLWLDASQRDETWIIWSPTIVDVEPWLRALARDNSELAQSKYYRKRQLATRSISRAGARLQ